MSRHGLVCQLTIVAFAATLAISCGCVDGRSLGVRPDSVPPETVISSSIVEVNPEGGYLARMNWYGYDPNDLISHYDVKTVQDDVAGEWTSTVSADSVFTIDPDVTQQWEFFVRAVNTWGQTDPAPATFVFPIPGGGR